MKNKARGNEAEMANIARGETRGNALTVLENFLYKFPCHYKTSNLTNLSAERL